jgi:hypothetical protein
LYLTEKFFGVCLESNVVPFFPGGADPTSGQNGNPEGRRVSINNTNLKSFAVKIKNNELKQSVYHDSRAEKIRKRTISKFFFKKFNRTREQG